MASHFLCCNLAYWSYRNMLKWGILLLAFIIGFWVDYQVRYWSCFFFQSSFKYSLGSSLEILFQAQAQAQYRWITGLLLTTQVVVRNGWERKITHLELETDAQALKYINISWSSNICPNNWCSYSFEERLGGQDSTCQTHCHGLADLGRTMHVECT